METIEIVVLKYCDENNIIRRYCGILFRKLLEILREKDPSCPHLIDRRFVNNLHTFLEQNVEAVDNQRVNSFLRRDCHNLTGNIFDLDEYEIEITADKFIFNHFLQQTHNFQLHNAADSYRVCFIHSCLLPNRNTSILEDILSLIHNTSLSEELTSIFVLNYGDDLTQRASFSEMVTKYPKVAFIQRSSDSSRFEVPTLRHLHSFATKAFQSLYFTTPSDNKSTILTPEQDIQILYLHTKGVSYKDSHIGVTDWTRMMLYFTVEEHRRCFHLLASGDFDAVGTNCHPQPYLHFAGNMWWATASYIRR